MMYYMKMKKEMAAAFKEDAEREGEREGESGASACVRVCVETAVCRR